MSWRFTRNCKTLGSLEVSTTPFYHPILPLVHNTDVAILDREGTTLPSRFSFPEDADAQIACAITLYENLFGSRPRDMWPAEGAVGESIIQHLRRHPRECSPTCLTAGNCFLRAGPPGEQLDY